MKIRRNVHTLDATDPILVWYARAIVAMRARRDDDPLSWSFQGAVHATRAVVPPPIRPFWNRCQHQTSFFLPWHRMYLIQFERIVAGEITNLGGPQDWALPYWNYNLPGQDTLPPAFTRTSMDDGSPNPLFIPQRNPAANAGSSFLEPADIDLTHALIAPGTTSFGGFFGSPAANHFGGTAGQLESFPHNTVHGAFKSGAFMADPSFAALDPIFWLHHANIDRLWEVWLNRDPNHTNLSSPFWLGGVTFEFHTAGGQVESMTTRDVLYTTAQGIEYVYDDVSDPMGGVGVASPLAADPPPTPDSNPPMELVGASMDRVQLGAEALEVTVQMPVSESAFLASVAETASARKQISLMALVLENVTSHDRCPTYDVYVNVPADHSPREHSERLAGRAALFGIAEASKPDGQHGGSGQTLSFNITDLYRRLVDEGDLGADGIRVRFVPVDPEKKPNVSVGRISLYVE